MHQPPDILTLAHKQAPMQEHLHLLQEKDRQIPGSVNYTIKRYHRNKQWNIEDTGMLVYHYERATPRESYLELKFCVTGNMYCRQKDTECDMCKFNESAHCAERVESIDVMSFQFSPVHLSQFIKPRKTNDTLTEDVLNFRHRSSFTKILPLCGKTRVVIEALLNHSELMHWPENVIYGRVPLLDGGLQLLRLWGYETLRKPTLPTSIGRLTCYNNDENTKLFCQFGAQTKGSLKLIGHLHFKDVHNQLVAVMENVEMCITQF